MTSCCCNPSVSVIKQVYRYDPGVSTNVPTPPAFTPNDRGIVPDDPMQPATCYPISTDGSGLIYNWNIETGLWV